MKRAILLTVLLASALAFGQKFEETDLSATDTPVSFSGTAKVSKTGTTCVVTAHNNSPQSLLAVEVTGEVTSPEGLMQSTGLTYDGFFKEAGIPPRSEEHTSELQSLAYLVCRLLLEKKKKQT